MLSISPVKSHGPDVIPNRIIKDYAYELADPVSWIFNVSLSFYLPKLLLLYQFLCLNMQLARTKFAPSLLQHVFQEYWRILL